LKKYILLINLNMFKEHIRIRLTTSNLNALSELQFNILYC